MSTVRLRRLQADYEKLRAFLAQQPRIRLIQAQGTPPERYQLEFQIKGLREVDEQLQTVANHMVEISLPLSYPRLPPQCRMLTPVFHPNIAPHAICIGDHWSAGEPLWSMVARIGEMIAYQSYNTKSPLNGEAARWVEANQQQLPLDRTNFVMDDTLPPPPPPFEASLSEASPSATSDDSIIPFAADPPAQRPIPVARPASPAPFAATSLPTAGAARRADLGPPLDAAADPGATPPPVPVARLATPVRPSAAPIVIECGQCRSRYSVPSTAAGRKVRCKKCQAILVIPLRPSLP
jgi:ubiquitin-protein ligase/ribosomal protein S27E